MNSKMVFGILFGILFIISINTLLANYTPGAFTEQDRSDIVDRNVNLGDWDSLKNLFSIILWDYRAIDILVQALVLVAAALGVASLFRRKEGR